MYVNYPIYEQHKKSSKIANVCLTHHPSGAHLLFLPHLKGWPVIQILQRCFVFCAIFTKHNVKAECEKNVHYECQLSHLVCYICYSTYLTCIAKVYGLVVTLYTLS